MNLPRSKARAVLSFTLALVAGSATQRAVAQSPAGATNSLGERNPAQMEAVEVTGSRIKRTDLETPSPVLHFDREMIEASGFSETDELLRSLSMNNGQAIAFEGSGNALATGTSTVNLRGLGNNNTLVLINGRRASPAGVGGFNGFQSVIDLRQVPLAWIESIEVLKDGASAIYGSDAVAGVINLKLRSNFSGVHVALQVGNTLGTDSFQRSGNFIAGFERGKTRLVVMGSATHRNAIKDIDYAFSASADLRQIKSGGNQGETDPTGRFTTGYDQRSASTFPARFYNLNDVIQTFSAPTTDPSDLKVVAVARLTNAGFYDFQRETYQHPETESKGGRVLLEHRFNQTIYGRLDFSFQHAAVLNAAASSPFSSTDKGNGTAGRLVVPAESPFNPFGNRYRPNGSAIELSTFRLVNAGPRFHDVDSEYPRLLAALGGKLSESWTWEVGQLLSRGSYRDAAPGASFDSKVQRALLGIEIDGQKLYANPFGPEDPRVTRFYSGTNPTKNSFSSYLSDLSLSGDLFQLPAGAAKLAVGGELRHDRLRDVRTSANESGDIVGGGEGFGFSASRRVFSAYAELKVPIFKSLELQLAGRMENYSDFGSTTKPKIALGYRPWSGILLRASFSQSFKAPDMAYLYSRGNVSFTTAAMLDPRRLDRPMAQIRTLGRGNRDLKPEEADTYSAGVIIEIPRGAFQGLTFDFGYFKFSQTNMIARDDAAFTLKNETLLPAGRVVRKPLAPADAALGFMVGTIDFLANDWYNAEKALRDGYDFAVRYPLKTRSAGQFDFSIDTTYLANGERTTTNSLGVRNTIDEDGRDPVSLWRGTGAVSWKKGFWSAALYVTGVGGFNLSPLGGLAQRPLKDQYLVSPQIGYAGFWGTRITLGVRNALNEDPPRYLDAQTGYYPQVNRVEKAFWYLRLSRDL